MPRSLKVPRGWGHKIVEPWVGGRSYPAEDAATVAYRPGRKLVFTPGALSTK
jgi:hypothetical protein